MARLERLEAIIEMARSLPFEVVFWTAQNVWSEVRRTTYQEVSQLEQQGDEEAREWVRHFLSLGEQLEVRVTDDVKVQTQIG